MLWPSFIDLGCRYLCTALRIAGLGPRFALSDSGPWFLEVFSVQAHGPLCVRFNAKGSSPLPNCLAGDSPPVADGKIRFLAHCPGQRSIKYRTSGSSATLAPKWPGDASICVAH